MWKYFKSWVYFLRKKENKFHLLTPTSSPAALFLYNFSEIKSTFLVLFQGYVVDGWHVNNTSTLSCNLLSVTLAEPRYLEKFDYGGRKMFWKASGIQERKIIIFIFLIKLLKDIHMILKF